MVEYLDIQDCKFTADGIDAIAKKVNERSCEVSLSWTQTKILLLVKFTQINPGCFCIFVKHMGLNSCEPT